MPSTRRFSQFFKPTFHVLRIIGRGVLWSAAGFVTLALICNFGLSTKRDAAHRFLHPDEPECRQEPAGWGILAEREIGNDEANAELRDPVWGRKLRCTLQAHSLPSSINEPLKPLTYHLAFLEFGEDGRPLPLQLSDQSIGSTSRVRSQLDALITHLEQRPSNYVVTFVHGWRHDASFGDGNVSDLRVYAAHAARFIAERSASEGRYGETEVTAVFVGWPGARVDERRITRLFGAMSLPAVGDWLASAAASLTLFDRKPISETIAPAALSALRRIDRTLDAKEKKNPAAEQRMIVFGHSLGGNLLITALKDELLKKVGSHHSGSRMTSPIGQQIVLINPASEAANWTAIQRAVWRRIVMREEEGNMDEIKEGHKFFPPDQKPVMISVTAARNWPPGGVRAEDCIAAETSPDLRRALLNSRRLEVRGIEYDAPTHDLFPAFRFDFRPVADSLTRWARRHAFTDSSDPCKPSLRHPVWSVVMKPAFWLADGLRYFPFINTDEEQARTIGHLESPRPSYGHLLQYRLSERPFGTTHELIGLHPVGTEQTLDYAVVGHHPKAACHSASGWLSRARARQMNGTFWDSQNLQSLPVSQLALPACKPTFACEPAFAR
jgi:hypothetical protein